MRVKENHFEFCQEHSGVCEKMNAIEKLYNQQRDDLNTMRNRSMATLITTVFTLIGIIITLITTLSK